MTAPIAARAARAWVAVVSAARTIMSSNFSSPSPVTAICQLLFIVVSYCVGRPLPSLVPANYANIAPSPWRESGLILTTLLSLRYFSLRAIPDPRHHDHASGASSACYRTGMERPFHGHRLRGNCDRLELT